ncbi:MAG: hypothetical protein KF760_31885 [Candidatus Eremiobacteraeota bacterium]|nr:hypothetical protein [Candidatus Eremiobacteraeota bacterium]MCW5869438.1 hypothetical protein [Candidatus Eremiobacteraeota bacterium]
MSDQSADYIVYQPTAPSVGTGRAASEAGDKTYPLTEGLWQQETLGVLELYGDKGKFSKP